MLRVVSPTVGQGLPMGEPREVGMSAEQLAKIDPVVQKLQTTHLAQARAARVDLR